MNGRLYDTLSFNNFTLNSRGETLTSRDETGEYLIKIQLKSNPKKARTLSEEFEIIKSLNDAGCQTCAKAYEIGEVGYDVVASVTDLGGIPPTTKFQYIIQEYLVNEGNYTLADLLFTIIEQKKLGVYQGDVKPDNVRFNPVSGVCKLVDYDQAVLLDSEKSSMNNVDFFKFCDEHDRNKYGFGNWLRHFTGVNNSHVTPFLRGGALNLANTTVFRNQKTTNSASGIYHTIDTPDVYTVGSRGLDQRAQILDAVEFKSGERVLDVGCNAGLLCDYLHDRGCEVTGVDNDPNIVIGAKMVANIRGRNIKYGCVDLDFVDDIGSYDTVMLFSVFHHTRDTAKNALKVTRACKRIIIETRLIENGKQPVDGNWVDTTRWSFQTLEDLIDYLEKTFSGFKYVRNLGFADKGRYVLEFVKQ